MIVATPVDGLIRTLRALRVPDDAAGMVRAVRACLESLHGVCTPEAPVDDRGDGKPGRVDLVVTLPGLPLLFIECDRLNPREKSIRKLKGLPGTRLILLRGVERDDVVDGVRIVGVAIEGGEGARRS